MATRTAICWETDAAENNEFLRTYDADDGTFIAELFTQNNPGIGTTYVIAGQPEGYKTISGVEQFAFRAGPGDPTVDPATIYLYDVLGNSLIVSFTCNSVGSGADGPGQPIIDENGSIFIVSTTTPNPNPQFQEYDQAGAFVQTWTIDAVNQILFSCFVRARILYFASSDSDGNTIRRYNLDTSTELTPILLNLPCPSSPSDIIVPCYMNLDGSFCAVNSQGTFLFDALGNLQKLYGPATGFPSGYSIFSTIIIKGTAGFSTVNGTSDVTCATTHTCFGAASVCLEHDCPDPCLSQDTVLIHSWFPGVTHDPDSSQFELFNVIGPDILNATCPCCAPCVECTPNIRRVDILLNGIVVHSISAASNCAISIPFSFLLEATKNDIVTMRVFHHSGQVLQVAPSIQMHRITWSTLNNDVGRNMHMNQNGTVS